MANEIRITRTVNYENGSLKYSYSPGTLSLPQSVQGFVVKTVSVTSVEADLSLAELNRPGVVVLTNLEPTTTGKTVNWGPKTSTGGIELMGHLRAKQEAIVSIASSTCILRWNGTAAGTVRIQVLGFEY